MAEERLSLESREAAIPSEALSAKPCVSDKMDSCDLSYDLREK